MSTGSWLLWQLVNWSAKPRVFIRSDFPVTIIFGHNNSSTIEKFQSPASFTCKAIPAVSVINRATMYARSKQTFRRTRKCNIQVINNLYFDIKDSFVLSIWWINFLYYSKTIQIKPRAVHACHKFYWKNRWQPYQNKELENVCETCQREYNSPSILN